MRLFLAAAAISLASCGGLQKPAVIDRLQPCKAKDGPTEAFCGTLQVWENRDAKSGRKIDLKILIFPALKRKAAPDPLFFLAGGPGQGAAAIAKFAREPFRNIGADRDLVFIDQRGTGSSNPLECKSAEDDDDDEGETKALARIRACLDKLQSIADLTQYTTPIAMDDLDEVRRFLGYEKINLYGGSLSGAAGEEEERIGGGLAFQGWEDENF